MVCRFLFWDTDPSTGHPILIFTGRDTDGQGLLCSVCDGIGSDGGLMTTSAALAGTAATDGIIFPASTNWVYEAVWEPQSE